MTYWRLRSDADGADDAAHARYVRLSAAAYRLPAGLVRRWTDTSEAALRAAYAADPAGSVATQGHGLMVADFVGTLVVEDTIHYLDMTAHLPAAAPGGLGRSVRRAAYERGAAGSTAAFVLIRSRVRPCGQRPTVDGAEGRKEIGAAADRFPPIR